ISLSTYGFCHGDRSAVGLSRMPMARNRCLKIGPYAVSRSRIRLARCTILGKRLDDLARNPLRGRICRHPERHPQPMPMTQNHKAIEQPERYRRQYTQVRQTAAARATRAVGRAILDIDTRARDSEIAKLGPVLACIGVRWRFDYACGKQGTHS